MPTTMGANWSADWAWSLSLITITIAIHAAGVVMMTLLLERIRARCEEQEPGFRYVILIAIGTVGTVGLLLASLHGVEAMIWAIAYLRLSALNSWHDAILYSVDSITTRGASGLLLHGDWQLMGALEAADGMLLFGISTAYLFAVLQGLWPMLSPRGRR